MPPGAVLYRSVGVPRGITQGTGAGVGAARGAGGGEWVPVPPALRLLLLVHALAGHRVVPRQVSERLGERVVAGVPGEQQVADVLEQGRVAGDGALEEPLGEFVEPGLRLGEQGV